MSKYAVNQKIVRETNQRLILEMVLKNKYVTRSLISKTLNLSPPSVSANVEKMISKGLLIEKGIEHTEKDRLGRKGILVQFNKNHKYIVIVDLSGQKLKVSIGNMYEEIILQKQIDFEEHDFSQHIYQNIIEGIDGLLKESKLEKQSIGVIVVASPGIINEKTGEMSHIPQFKDWEKINIKSLLERDYHVKVLVRNDINVMAIGEQKYGLGKGVKNFVHFNIEYGVGAGLILNEQLYNGWNYASGEVGYMVPSFDHLSIQNNKGVLESLISMPQIKKDIAKALHRKEITEEEITTLYQAGEICVLEEIELLAKILAVSFINITAVLNVSLITIGGSISELKVDLIKKIKRHMQGMIPFQPEIQFSLPESNNCTKGALIIGAEQILQSLILDQEK